MNKRKICVIVASRANYGRIKSVLQAISAHDRLELQLIVEASALLYKYGNVIETIEQDGLKVTATAYSVVDGENLVTMAKSTGLAVMELSTLFDQLKPDVVLTVADRFETMATAVTASYMNIAVAHTQGGELTGSIDESVRHAISKLSHIHFPSNDEAAKVLYQLGENPERVYITGCPAIDLAANAVSQKTENLFELYGGTGYPLNWDKPYIVVLQHPVTTEYTQGAKQIEETLEAVRRVGMQTVWLWPNVDAGSDAIAKRLRMFLAADEGFPVHFYRNFRPEDYVHLINRAVCLVGNSSSGIREGAFLGTPVVNIGTRQNCRQRGENVMDVQYDSKAIYDAIQLQLAHGKYNSVSLYGDGGAGERIADILSSCDLSITKSFFHV
ncbi:UDP-N-acetylglucosamine 2-epimerase [Pseudodesulfovibrio piezophilus]|uniref:UDP-N-acetylglucosamine 2-epimerase n=1 Tax=Pseudodesulfovibrio piezophilus (strain DSM 21447 / JCM 15486 / C1TLV30) TaxID=1322246 RepID=M1WS25_PSEP2|nr:UDP-N-acetylglucosamine 2-epimerase [Pseudodesulfovibrio piezophilus]CCH49914.1 UDP-N-acetylglucosamine 2-epimerase [Pseudodesulfovibrio piezophilus C1TLV30]